MGSSGIKAVPWVGKKAGEMWKAMSEGKRRKMQKDPNKPKRPAGGAYGVWLNENRQKIIADLPKGSAVGAIGQEAGKRWKALTAMEQKPYQEKYEKLNEAYKEAMKNYVPPGGAEDEE